MKLTPIKNWVSAPLLFPALIFLLVNTSTSYNFYHVNSYKIVLMILGVTIFAVRNIPLFPSKINDQFPWKIWLFMAVPLLATIPGLVQHQLGFNYNFRYELAAYLVLFLWVVYLYRLVEHENDLNLFFVFIGLAVIYNGCWSVLEKTGFHPLAWNEPVKMVKATFGHRNYFSGFLIVLLPLIFVFAIPDKLFKVDQDPVPQEQYPQTHLYYMIVFFFGCLSLILAQTRAAIAAFALALALVCFLYVRFFAPEKWRKRVLLIYGAIMATGICLMMVILLNPDLFSGSRFAQLFTMKAWMGRRLAWETALSSSMASPLFGFGLGSSYDLFFSFVDPDARLFHFEHSYNHAHSEILEYIQEGGLIGLTVYVAFWAWLVWRLIKLLKNPHTNSTCLKLGIGICGGFLAFHIHGSFSVAPRMMVMRLPVYTLIAITLIIDNLCKTDTHSEIRQPTLRSRLMSGLPTLTVLAVTWVIFLPWAAGQWQFFAIRQERPAYLQIRNLTALTGLTPDIYALDHLARKQIEYNQLHGLKQTLDTIDRIIPYYRNVGYKKTVHAALSGDPEQAKRIGLASQLRDRYHQPTIDLLIKLAVKSNDLPMFKEQFSLSLRKHVFSHGLNNSLSADDVQILFVPGENPLKIIGESDTITFQWSEKLIGVLFDSARKHHQGPRFSDTDKEKYFQFLKSLITKQPWFQLNILDSFENNRQSLLEDAKAYQLLNSKWDYDKVVLEYSHRKELSQTPAALKKGVYSRQQADLAKAQKAHSVRQKVYDAKLKGKTDWDFYKRKQDFIKSFIGRFIVTVFPTNT